MKKNIHRYDRLARILIALVVGGLILTNQIGGTAAILLGIAAFAFVVTGFVGFCPVYRILKLSTKKAENTETA